MLGLGQNFLIDGGLGSLSTPLQDEAVGPSGITFNSDGTPYVVIGNGGPQAATSLLGVKENQLGILINAALTGAKPKMRTVANLAAYQYTNQLGYKMNPDGTPNVESNPFGVTSIGENVYVADGAAETVVQVTPAGAISLVGVMPQQQVNMPAYPGGPVPATLASVPTGIIPSPDGNGVLAADYSGFPYFPGTSRIWHMQAGQTPTLYASGLTNVIGLSPAADGGVYALELASNGANSGDPGGAVIHIDPAGAQTVLACQGLIQPTGIASGPDGNLYIANYGLNSGFGEIVQVKTQ